MWLDAGLRRGEPGRLAREYPLSMGRDGTRRHQVVYREGRPAAHAMLHPVEATARGGVLRIGLIGNVYTDEAHRNRGLASRCVEACLEEARRDGLSLVLLWSDAWAFYARLGFHPAGRETFTALDSRICARAFSSAHGVFDVAPPRPCDWRALEALYAEKPQRARRRAGDLLRLAGAPACVVRVASKGGAPVAYAVLGRGDDFTNTVHEWAGDAEGVLACLGALVKEAAAGLVLSGPVEEAPIRRLHEAGARTWRGCFALAHVLDADLLWRTLVPRDAGLCVRENGGRVHVEGAGTAGQWSHAQLLDLLFGAGVESDAAAALAHTAREALADVLPWPLYVWGFDSI